MLVILLLFSSASQPQSKRTTDASNAALSIPQTWGSITLRLFKDSEKEDRVLPRDFLDSRGEPSGPIPIPDQGLPLELTAAERTLEMNVPEADEKFVVRAHGCSMELSKLDHRDGFTSAIFQFCYPPPLMEIQSYSEGRQSE